MKTQEQIREEIDRLLDEGRLDEAEALGEQLVPISAEEFRRRLDNAPSDDEPVTREDRAAFDRAWSVIRGSSPERNLRRA